MSELNPKGIELRNPLTRDVTRMLKPGDIVYVTGEIVSGIAEFQSGIVERGNPCPYDNAKYNIFAIGYNPLRKEGDRLLPADASRPALTTGIRYLRWAPNLIRKLDIKAIACKAGLGTDLESIKACAEKDCVALTLIAPLPRVRVGLPTEVKEAYGFQGGIGGEAFYDAVVFKVDKWGPMIVNIDTRGNSLIGQIREETNRNKLKIYERIGIPTDYGRTQAG